jgi:mRNA interferase RelE/StbE
MPYSLDFLPSALKEWNKWGETMRKHFAKKLRERLEMPRMPASARHGMPDHDKIKLRQAGYRLVYRVKDSRVTVIVVAVGRRDHNEVYEAAQSR